MKDFQGFTKDGYGPVDDNSMDYRKEIVNLSKQLPQLRFGQFIENATSGLDISYLEDADLYEHCKRYVTQFKKRGN